MSIALEAKVKALEARVIELEAALSGGSGLIQWSDINPLEMLSNVAQIEMRLERIEAARKPGPKPKSVANG